MTDPSVVQAGALLRRAEHHAHRLAHQDTSSTWGLVAVRLALVGTSLDPSGGARPAGTWSTIRADVQQAQDLLVGARPSDVLGVGDLARTRRWVSEVLDALPDAP